MGIWEKIRSRFEEALLDHVERRDDVEVLRLPPWKSMKGFGTRALYQLDGIDFAFHSGMRVLDIGSGADPFPHATVLLERYLEPTEHRSKQLQTDSRPLIQGDVGALPFRDKAFDFVVCNHVLEHVEDPLRACRELMRIGRAGYIESPSDTSNMLFAWGGKMHRWNVLTVGKRLVFVEYTPRQREGVRTLFWRKGVLDKEHSHPYQKVLSDNLDIFNTMFQWDNQFPVSVYWLDGRLDQYEPARIASTEAGRCDS